MRNFRFIRCSEPTRLAPATGRAGVNTLKGIAMQGSDGNLGDL